MASLDGYHTKLLCDTMRSSMKKLLVTLCLLLVGLVTMGAAPSIKSYSETFKMVPSGAGRVSSNIELTDLVPGTLDVPLTTWKGLQEIKWDGVPAGVQVQPVLKGDTPYIRLTIPPGAAAGMKLRLEYDVPAPKPPAQPQPEPEKEKKLYYRFLNNVQAPVSAYSLKLLLPEGDVVHSVVEKTPKGKGAEAAQVKYIAEDNRQGLVLEAKNLKFGDTAGVRLIVVPDKKSPVLIFLLGVIAIIYLYAFREIVSKPGGTSAGVSGKAEA